MPTTTHRCYVCGNAVSFTEREAKCTSCDTTLEEVPDSAYAIPVGMELPEEFHKVDLDKVVRITSTEEEAKAKRFRKKDEDYNLAIDEISLKLLEDIKELVTETIRMELNGESASRIAPPTPKKESKGLKQSGKKFAASRKITANKEVAEETDKSKMMMTPDERSAFVKAHQDEGQNAKRIAAHEQPERRVGIPFFLAIIIGLLCFFMLIAYGTYALTKSSIERDKAPTETIEQKHPTPTEETTSAATSSTTTAPPTNVAATTRANTYNMETAKFTALEFLNARDLDYASKFISPFSNAENLLAAYWSPLGEFHESHLKAGSHQTSPSGTAYTPFYLNKGEIRREVIILQDASGQYAVDWKSFMGIEEYSLSALKPGKARGKVTLRSFLKLSAVYSAQYPKEDWISLAAISPAGELHHLYLPRGSALEQTLYEGMPQHKSKKGLDKTGRYIYNALCGVGSQPVIIDILSTRWVE